MQGLLELKGIKMRPSSPQHPLPPPLHGADPDSFPQRTVSGRLPSIARRVLEESDWHAQGRANLEALISDMPQGVLRPLRDSDAPDAAAWERDLAPYLGQTWLEAPWFVAETYFFRRILEAIGYYQLGAGQGVDPYAAQKRQELALVEGGMRPFCEELDRQRLENSGDDGSKEFALTRLLRLNIWGNQADLSMWPGGSEEGPERRGSELSTSHLVVDHAPLASRYLDQLDGENQRLDIILDNSGLELAFDLGLVDFLLTRRVAQQINLHAKSHPTYVSDATIQDVLGMVAHLETSRHTCVRNLAKRLQGHLADGYLLLKEDYFWTSPLSGWEMLASLREDLGRSQLVVSKGDANYRRWLGDRHWPHATPIDQILAYFPAPLLMLRVLKANIIAGLPDGLAGEMYRQDPEWLHDGNWGIIQLAGLPTD